MGGVLHTSSHYATNLINLNLSSESHSKSDINNLRAKEMALYRRFGASSYEEFIQKIRELFNGRDREIIQNFEANKLQKTLSQFALSNNYMFNEDVRFVFNFNNAEIDFGSIKLKSGVSISAEPINLNFNPAEIREVLNRYFLHHNFKKGYKEWTKNLDNFIKDLTSRNILTIQSYNAGSNSYEEIVNINTIPNFPWGVTKKDIELARQLGKDSEINQELQRACIKIKDYIFNTLGSGASPDLLKAMNTVWNNNFIAKQNNPALFFSGGTKSNFISGVQGALGEFQAALIFEYLAVKKTTSAFANIIGNVYKNGEQLRTDVAIFNELGLQVKNVGTIMSSGSLSLIRNLTTTMHPDKFAQYMDDGQSFLDFIANYYFNISYQAQAAGQFDNLLKWLENYLGELMNMAMSDAVDDTVTFYMIGGQYLVPGSAILDNADSLDLANSITITSAYAGLTDVGYRGQYTFVKDKARPEFVKYWNKKHSSWKPTEENTKIYNNLVSKGISIRTNFNLLENIASFSIF